MSDDRKKKIMVVDDDTDQREIYVSLFKQNGFEVNFAEDGLVAYDMILNDPPDLLFTGVIMPKMDGFELIDHLRKHALTSKIPVILFSHLGREEDRKKAEGFQNVHFTIKGYDSPADILKKVKSLLVSEEKKLGLNFQE